MKKGVEWILALGILALLLGGALLTTLWGWGMRGWCCGGWWLWGMMGRGSGAWGFTLMILIFLGLIILGMIGLAWLVRGLIQSPGGFSGLRCPNCQRAVQHGWLHCPYCGTSLER